MTLVALCPSDQVTLIWPRVCDLLDPIAKYSAGRQYADDIYYKAQAGSVQIWLCSVDGEIVASAVTEIKEYPAATCLDVLFVGGKKLGSWLKELIGKLERFGKEMRCDRLEMLGRQGWSRILSGHGFHAIPSSFMEKPL